MNNGREIGRRKWEAESVFADEKKTRPAVTA